MIKDRIKEFKRVKAGELMPSPHNWRRHPEHQKEALQSILNEVGYADAILVREVPSGYELVDGHLRSSLDSEQMVPVLVLDLNEDEAKAVLVTHDPIAGLAETDGHQLSALIEEMRFDSDEINGMLEAIIREADRSPLEKMPPSDFALFDDDIETQFQCPSCHYEWSGASK